MIRKVKSPFLASERKKTIEEQRQEKESIRTIGFYFYSWIESKDGHYTLLWIRARLLRLIQDTLPVYTCRLLLQTCEGNFVCSSTSLVVSMFICTSNKFSYPDVIILSRRFALLSYSVCNSSCEIKRKGYVCSLT